MQYLGVMWRTEFDFELVYLSKGLKLHPFQCTCCLEQRERDNIVRFCDLSIQVATALFDSVPIPQLCFTGEIDYKEGLLPLKTKPPKAHCTRGVCY